MAGLSVLVGLFGEKTTDLNKMGEGQDNFFSKHVKISIFGFKINLKPKNIVYFMEAKSP